MSNLRNRDYSRDYAFFFFLRKKKKNRKP